MSICTVDHLADLLGLDRPGRGGSAVIDSVEFDTRRLRPGALFVALAGENVDGHDFGAAAVAAGAVAVLGSASVYFADGPRVPVLTVVDDDAVQQALATLAHDHAERLIAAGLTVVGVTGSSGKTSTKDLIAAVLAAGTGTTVDYGDGDAVVVAPRESFNNELGHPYTVLRARDHTRFLVLELSARGPGHIAMLARVARPRIGAVLNVGSAHLGEFGSVDGIALAKGELVEALPADGVAILNLDDPRVAAMASRTAAPVVTVGVSPAADLRAEDLTQDAFARSGFRLVTPEGSAPVQLAVAGEHQVGNALTAAAVGRAVGLDLPTIATALGQAGPASKWRMDVTQRSDGVTVVNDAYNANPESVRAALRALAVIGRGRRTWAILGEMAELGDTARQAQDEIGRLAVRLGVDQLLTVGEVTRPMYLGACLEGSFDGEAVLVPDWQSALETARSGLRPGDVVLVKASRSVGLERVALALLADVAPATPQQQPQDTSKGQDQA